MRLVIDGVERSVPGEMTDPAAVSLLGRDPAEEMLARESDGRHAGDTKQLADVFEDGDELTFVPRPKLPPLGAA